jgi:Ca-activated chloride channel family protein
VRRNTGHTTPQSTHATDASRRSGRRVRSTAAPRTGRELQLISQTAQVSIKGGVARTKLLQTFQNTTNHTIEGVYVFPLPEGAAVSGFAMMVNGKRQEAEILDGDKAREIYTGIVQKDARPGDS